MTDENRSKCSRCGMVITEDEQLLKPLSVEHSFGHGSIYDLYNLKMRLCMKCSDDVVPILESFCSCRLLNEYKLSGDIQLTDEEIISLIFGYGEQ